MADLLRPLKTQGTRQYQTEYSLGQQFAKDAELDADLDGIYRAWNTQVPPGVTIASTEAKVAIGPAPPSGAAPGQLWWRNDPDGNLFIRYNDGTTEQWVPAVPIGTGVVELSTAISELMARVTALEAK